MAGQDLVYRDHVVAFATAVARRDVRRHLRATVRLAGGVAGGLWCTPAGFLRHHGLSEVTASSSRGREVSAIRIGHNFNDEPLR
jgi:hypothetical protein